MVERVPIEVTPTEANERYLRAKEEKLGHMLRFVEDKRNEEDEHD